jgi:hypothetical protein
MGLAVGLAALGLAAGVARRPFIRTFFRVGPPGAAPALVQPAAGVAGLSPVSRVRVLLIDGLDAWTARGLPALDGLCRAGLDLAVDVGFPTVSLPVQAALWTGRSQQQSGLLYRIAALPTPPPDAVAVAVQGSVAVSEDQPFIARSFGFRMLPAAGGREGPDPATSGFGRTALEAVAGAAPLAFVHVLRVDKAGHKLGGSSEAYRAAASWADRLLGLLLQAAPPDAGTRWFVVSDHGHRPGGGHGGAERSLRITRGCIAGGEVGRAPGDLTKGSDVHLVDVARALRDSLGVPAAAGSAGRPLPFARAHPDPDATLPRLGAARAGLALLVLLAAIALWLRPRPPGGWPMRFPLWLPAAYLGVLLIRGLPTLSNPIVYPPLGRDAIVASLPGLLLLAATWLWRGPREPRRLAAFCRAQLALPAGVTGACLVACGGVGALLGGPPPLLPFWTAHASVFLSQFAAGALLLGLSVACGALWAPRR